MIYKYKEKQVLFEAAGFNCSLSLASTGLNLKVKFTFSSENSNKSDTVFLAKKTWFIFKQVQLTIFKLWSIFFK